MTVPTIFGFHAIPLPVAQLSLAAVLHCGQSFRWISFSLPSSSCGDSIDSPTHEYRLCLHDRVVCLRQTPDTLFYRIELPVIPSQAEQVALAEAQTLTWLRDYFQLDIDLTKLYDQWDELDPVFRKLRPRFSGIRMLRQDPWENLISFICSSNNNISRITKMVQSLCRHFSPALMSICDPSSSERQSYHPFPPPSMLAKPETSAALRSLGFGYRAEYIQRTAKMLVDAHGIIRGPADSYEASERWLCGLRDLDTAAARDELLKFVGVGRKVADCVLLMSLDKRNVIPVDTHVYQIAIKHYGVRSSMKATLTPKVYEEINEKLVGVWGNYAGWAHSVLFTADLKSFSSFGLPTVTNDSVVEASPQTPSSSPGKRRRGSQCNVLSSGSASAGRAKRRRQ